MSGHSSTTRALFEAAKADAPSSAARASMWGGVAAKTGAAGVGAGVGTLTFAKVLAAGAVVGAVGVGSVVVATMPGSHGSDRASSRAPVAIAAHGASRVGGARAARSVNDEAASVALVGPDVQAPVANDLELGDDPVRPAPASVARSAANSSAGADPSDALTREARMVAEARGALVRGNPDEALATVRATRALPRRALEPEELSIEARSLRALGRVSEADAIEATLRSRFPDHALAR